MPGVPGILLIVGAAPSFWPLYHRLEMSKNNNNKPTEDNCCTMGDKEKKIVLQVPAAAGGLALPHKMTIHLAFGAAAAATRVKIPRVAPG